MRLAIAVFVLSWLGLSTPVGAADLKGHIAVYKLTVNHPGVEADGQLLISAHRACKTWSVTQTSSLELGAGGRTVLVMVQQHQSQESADGRSMTSKSEANLNGQKAEVSAVGMAAGLGRAGKVEVEQAGAKRTVTLPEGAYFGIGASARLIDELKAGKKKFSITGFDQVTTNELLTQNYEVVASPFTQDRLPGEHGGLLDGKSWNVKSSFEVRGAPQAVFVTLHESGVISRMLLPLDKVKVEYTLTELRPLPASPCG